MARPSSIANVEIETGERSQRATVQEPDSPFHIAVLGDFSGRENRGVMDRQLKGRTAVMIDRDNFEDMIARLAPELHLPLGGPDGPRIPIRFRELDDFHPDRIFEQLKIFQALRGTRERLNDRSTFDAAAAEVRSWSGGAAPAATPAPGAPAQDISRLSASELFEQAMSATESRSSAARPARALDDFQALLRDIVAPYAEPKPDPQKADLIAQVDAAISGQMRALLHHADFQALEAAWRGVFFLIRRLATDERLKVYLLDIAKPELAADMVATYELLIEKTPGGEPWAVLAGNYRFDQSEEDMQLLGRMAAVARHAGAPFLAAASPRVLGCDSLAETPEPRKWRAQPARNGTDSWDALRRLPQASWLGLALPRFLLRLPYGKQTESTEQFAFEEFSASPQHEDYLWGNPALACAYLLGEAFSESGWDLRPGAINEISGLPAHIYRADGESHLKPCAEALLTEHAAEAILDRGLMPFLSIRGSDSIRLVRFQSLATPPAPLSGRWS
ncbi:MAG TPA: type VI secretion system contractile sheath large subunit [Bryobacteraceae bacterium]|nr:type VI secretion system contractile sheath large subunit [Bryobacteraceae bacterium]